MSAIFRDAKLAAVQAAPVFLDLHASVEKARSLVEEAASNGATVVGFPEEYLAGFPEWFNFHLPESKVSRTLSAKMFENALEVGSPAADAIADVARKTRTYVVIGANERDPGTLGTMYNSQFTFGPDGRLLGVHRKLVPTTFERLVHAPGDGSTLRTYDTEFGRVGGLICGENTGSLARFSLLAQQERIHVASWPAFTKTSFHEWIDIRVKYHAFEGKVYVISACGVFDDTMIDVIGLTPEQVGELPTRGGHSGIIGPNGAYLAGPADDTEQILYAETDYDYVIQAKWVHDLTGHYNRYDIFSLDVTPSEKRLLGPHLASISGTAVTPERADAAPTE